MSGAGKVDRWHEDQQAQHQSTNGAILPNQSLETYATLCNICQHLFRDDVKKVMSGLLKEFITHDNEDESNSKDAPIDSLTAKADREKWRPFYDFKGLKASAIAGCDLSSLVLAQGTELHDAFERRNPEIVFVVTRSWPICCHVRFRYDDLNLPGRGTDIYTKRTIAMLSIYGVPDGRELIGAPLNSDSTGSDQTFEKIENWMADCSNHSSCIQWLQVKQNAKRLPTRLIRVGRSSDFSDLCLENSESAIAAVLYRTVYLLLGRVHQHQKEHHMAEKACAKGESNDCQSTEQEPISPYYGEGDYDFLVLTPDADTRGRFKRIANLRFGVHYWVPPIAQHLRILDKHLRSNDVPEQCFDQVDDDFMYTITLVSQLSFSLQSSGL